MEDLFEDVVIDLGDAKFRLRERTKTVGEKADSMQERFQGMESENDAAELMIEMLDLLLEPLGDGNNGTRTHAKTVLSKAWKENKIGSDRIIGLANFCLDKMTARVDPTSRQQTGD